MAKQQNTPQSEIKEKMKDIAHDLDKDLIEKTKIIDDYVNTMKRLQADFENYVKRSSKEKEDYAKMAVAKILSKFVDIMDDLDRAMNILEKTQDGPVKDGIKMVHNRFHKILIEEGIKPIETKGKKVDPYMHDVIEMVAHDSPEGIIVEELQKGYNMGDKVLRAAKVKVSKGKGDKK